MTTLNRTAEVCAGRLGRIFLAAVILVTLASTATPAAADEWTVNGIVSYANGSPAPYAIVVFMRSDGGLLKLRAGGDGRFSFSSYSDSSSSSAWLWGQLGNCAGQPQQLMDRDVTQNLTIPGNGGGC